MKRKILWLFLSCLVVLTLVVSSCGVTTTVDGEQQEEEEEEEEENEINDNSTEGPDGQSEPTFYTLTTSVAPENTGSVLPDGGQYEDGTHVTITATPLPGFKFIEWRLDVLSTNPTITVTMDSDKLIEAVFIPTLAPVISEVSIINITETSAEVTWITNEAATSQVEYGKTTGYGLTTPKYSGLVTEHRVTLINLEPSTNYHFRVKSGTNGSEAISSDFTLTTLNVPTEVGGIVASDTTWTKADSPYVITSTVQIPFEVTLTIEPGVTVSKPTSGDMFLLMGTIHAHGTAQESIVIDGGSNSKIIYTQPGYGYGDFQYCIFKNGYALWDRWGHLDLRYSQLMNLSTGGTQGGKPYDYIIQLDGPSGKSNIEYNKFINTGGIYSYDDKYGTNIKNNLFQGLLSPLAHMGGGTPSNPPKQMIVKYNSFIAPKGLGLALSLASGFIGWSPSIDATENYWGTQDTNIIDQMIHDKNDDITIDNNISYLPILTEPHPNTPD